MVLESNARFIGPGHAAIMNDNGTNWLRIITTTAITTARRPWLNGFTDSDGWPAVTNDWSAFYPFNTDAASTSVFTTHAAKPCGHHQRRVPAMC